MRNNILIISLIFAVGITAMSIPIALHSIFPQGGLQQPQTTRETDEFIKRLKDEKFRDIHGGSVWTLTHDYEDHTHMEEALDTLQRYMEALAKYERGDGSSLKRLGGGKQLKDQLAKWLEDNDQAIRAFAATMLGISGDQSYSPPLAKLLVRKEQNAGDIIYDRGRAALALGLLQAKEYGKDLVTMLSSTNEYDRLGAAQGLGWMGDKENAKAVAQLLKDKDERVREAARQSLEMMGARDLIKDKN
jgi:HEAT repeat protein